jgi:CubicO group peptidase (beta-lactamase class C family)
MGRLMITTALTLAAFQAAPALPALDSLIHRLRADVPWLAVAVAVVRGDSVLHVAGYGQDAGGAPVTGTTPFYIASSTKSFTALTAVLLARRGIVDLDIPVARYAPAFTLPAPLDPSRVTLRTLLSHRGGFESAPVSYRTAFSGDLPRDSLLALVARTATAVDTGFTYTNTQFIVAARVLELVTGTPWQELVTREVLRPLRLTRSAARYRDARGWPLVTGMGPGPDGVRPVPPKDDAIMHAAGGMVMSAADAATWLRAQLTDGRVAGRAAFPAGAVAATHRRQAIQRDSLGDILRVGYGLGWQIGVWNGDTVYHHFGNYPGAFAHISFMPDARIGVAVLLNSELPAHRDLHQVIAQAAYDAARARPVAAIPAADSLGAMTRRMEQIFTRDFAQRAARGISPPRGWAPYAGTYRHPDYGPLTIVVRGDSAWLHYGLIRTRVEVFRGDDIRLETVAGRASGTVARPTFDDAGRVVALTAGGLTFRR